MFEVYSDYIDGDLDQNQKKDVENHIKTCTECQSCIATLKKTKELCSNLPRKEAPKNFSKRLHDKINNIFKDD